MAIQKSSNFKGVDANYYKILVCNYDALHLKNYVVMGLYVSQETRDANIENYLTTIDFNFDGAQLTLADAYTKIKENEPFTDAIDIL